MNFASLLFIWLFLPFSIGGYYILRFFFKNIRVRNVWLLLCSLLFYAWGEAKYIYILVVTILLSYLGGKILEKSNGKTKKRCVLFFTIAILVCCLAYFKYFNDILYFLKGVRGTVHLPIGISFFTFQAISFLIDVYRDDAKIDSVNLLDYSLYVSFFPQLIAGPIIKFKEIKEQIENRKENTLQFSDGVHFFAMGFFRKVIIANGVATIVDRIYQMEGDDLTFWFCWLAAISYTIQIYYDFSGYSLMAIGLGKMFGFDIVKNFDCPYLSKSISDFWRRWHISLGSWFREYVYIPLGGNRKGNTRTYINLVIVFLLTGIWHGSGATFILWGAYYAFWIVLERIVKRNIDGKKNSREKWKCKNVVRNIYSIFVVIVGWVIFRSEDLSVLQTMLFKMFTPFDSSVSHYSIFEIINHKQMIIILISILWIVIVEKREIHIGRKPVSIVMDMGALLLGLASLTAGAYNPFIYFRF